MSDLDKLAATFRDLATLLEGGAPSVATLLQDAETACDALQAKLNETILPRRITIENADGAKLSLMAKDRRIIALKEVYPFDLWRGDKTPLHTEVDEEPDGFIHPFAVALQEISAGRAIRIDSDFADERVDPVGGGFPAERLSQAVAETRALRDADDRIDAFFDAFPHLPRACRGAEDRVHLPDDARVDAQWLQVRLDELLAGEGDEAMLVHLDGDAPLALALIRIGEQGCVVLGTAEDDIDALGQLLFALCDGH